MPSVGATTDAAELEADRVAGSIGGLAAVPVRSARPVSVQRQPTPPAGSQAAADAAAKAAVEAEVDRVIKAGLAEAITVEPLKSLVAQGRAALATPGGKLALAEVIASVIAASALARRPLPITSWTQDLGDVSSALSGASVQLTWEGPTNAPTKAAVKISYSPPGGPLRGTTVTGSAQTGSTTATGGGGSISYAPPGGPLRGASISVGASGAAGQPVRGEVGIGYRVPSGVLRGAEARVTGSADTSGAAGVGVGLTIPIGSSGSRSSRARDDVSADTERLRAANRASAEMGKTDAQREAERREEEAMIQAWVRAHPVGTLQRAAAPGVSVEADAGTASAAVDAAIAEPGAALPVEVRSNMEDALGHDFSRVRVHTGARAATSARSLGALAYTVGSDVVFGTDRWEPASPVGQRLLAHELTHVIQQGQAEVQ